MSIEIRMCDIPTEIIDRACRELLADEWRPEQQAEILAAAVMPSERVYRLPDSVRPLVDAWKVAA